MKHLVRSTLGKRFIKVQGTIPKAGSYTFLDVEWDFSLQTVLITSGSYILPHKLVEVESLAGVTELCAGLGAMSLGLEKAGCTIKAKNDLRESFTKFLNRDGYHRTICGNIALSETLSAIHSSNPDSSILTAGFSCQPWSKLGDKKKSKDMRSQSFVSALRAGYLLRSHAILLECVGESGKDPQVLEAIRQFCQKTGYWFTDTTLHLEHCWPSKRERWWCLIVNPTIPRFTIPPLPRFPQSPTVGHVLPVFPQWPEEETNQLMLDAYEYGCFAHYSGIPNVVIDINKPLATALHGWGNQLMGCPCGCRSSPLSIARLREKGLWGALLPMPTSIQVQGQSVTACRHIHPWELAILTGCDSERNWLPSLKLSLCGLGQQASPFHSGWLVSHLLNQIHQVYSTPKPLTPSEVLWEIASKAFASRDQVLPQTVNQAQVADFVKDFRALVLGHHQENIIPSPIQRPSGAQTSTDSPVDQSTHSKTETEDTPETGDDGDHEKDHTSQPIQDDGYGESPWICPFHDCCICISSGEKPPINEVPDAEILAVIKSLDDPQISPTLPFSIESDPPEHVEVKRSPTFSNTGGHFAFATTRSQSHGQDPKRSLDLGLFALQTEPDPKRHRVDDISSNANQRASTTKEGQGTVETVDLGTSVFPLAERYEPSQKEEVNMDNSKNDTRVPKGPSVIRLQLPEDPLPSFVKTSPGASFRSIAKALRDIGLFQGPIRFLDTLGQPVSMKDCPLPFQHVVVQNADQYRTMECHDNCQPHQWFDSEERCPRIQMLFRQESWVAKDEMDFYIDVFNSTGLAQGQTTLVFDDFPDQLEQWVQQCLNATTQDKTVVSAVLLDQHWIPFAFVRSNNDMAKVVTSKEGTELLSYCKVSDVQQTIPLPHLFKADCGFQTIGWLVRLVLDPSSSFGPKHFGDLFPPITVAAAASWRGMFEHHLFVTGRATRTVVPSCIRVGGVKGDIVEAQLQDMLQEHAVPIEQCKSRADMIIEKLGRTAVTKALRANRPWVELKSLANGMTPKIQIVLPSELQEAIKKRAAEGKVVGDKTRKKHSSTHDPIPVQLHPSDLTIPDGVFKQGNDTLIRQIQLSSIGKSSQGVVIVNAAQAGPYLHLSKPVSSEGLGLLVLDHQDPAIQGVGQIIQFPAKFEKSGEPLITRARLIQLGTAEVSRHVPQHLHCVDEVKTAVLRALVFRDELECSWEDFVQHPVKYILQHSAPLIGGSSPESNVLDVWDRQFVGLKLDKAPPKRAEIYIVSFRVMNLDVNSILDMSGNHAIYFEPRDDVGRQPHSDYRVVWIPKTDKRSVLASVQLAEHWTCLARSGNKFGIRTATQHAQELHEAHKPAVPFLEASSLTTFIVGPMPYGATRSSLVKLFGQWEWKARPCQPRGRSADGNGVLWECQASEPPQFEIYTMKHADVLVSPIEKKKPGIRPSNDIVASAKTIAILKQQNSQPSNGFLVDPLQTHDPWQAYSTPQKQAKVSFQDGSNFQPGHGGPNMETINRVVEQKLEARFAQIGRHHPNGEDADMGDTQDARITEMEHRLSSLESVVQSNQVQQVQHQSQVTAQISSLQQRVDTQGSALQRHMDEKLNEQLSHIERLLGRGDKKARGE